MDLSISMVERFLYALANAKGGKTMDLLEHCYVPLVRTYMVKERLLPYGKEEVCSPKKVVALVKRLLMNVDREYFIVISVDAKSKPVGVEIVSIGTVNATLVQAREVFKHAILCNATGIIMLHNHPSGSTNPSEEDWKVTRRMQRAGQILGVDVIDHIIVGDDNEYRSLAEEENYNADECK